MRRSDDATTSAAAGAASTTAVDATLARFDAVVGEVVDLDLSALDEAQLGTYARAVSRQAGRLEAARARAVTAAEASGAVERAGARDGATWLADTTGGTVARAREAARLATAMDTVPSLGEAVASGELGGDQARSLSSAAERGVLDTERLDELVVEGTRAPAGMFATGLRAEEGRTDQRQRRRDEQLARERRSVRWWKEDDGSVRGRFHLDPVAGETVLTALDALSLPDTADVPDELRRTAPQRRADALETMAQLALSHDDMPRVTASRPHITVTMPVSMLADSDAAAEAAGAVGTLPDGTVVSAELSRRLLCDGIVERLVLGPEGQPLDVGRATRVWNGAQRTALHAIDGQCRGPACDSPAAWTEIHHVRWWRNGGPTSLVNGLLLCIRCHDLVHHQGWTLLLDPQTRRATWTSPAGRIITTDPCGPAAGRRRS